MKHAYLILAHNEFDLLLKLIEVIDDPRNDIFVHFDLKVKDLPSLQTNYSHLCVVDQRIDVRWGDVSVVEAEYALFEKAFEVEDKYSYYHLLSGVDLPLKSQDYIHTFFKENHGKEFIGFNIGDNSSALDRKVNRYHFFPEDFKDDGSILCGLKKIIRAIALKGQLFCGIRRNKKQIFKKGTQWVSVTPSFVQFILSEKKNVLEVYKNTFCPDEIFIQTLCWNSVFRPQVFDLKNEGRGCQRMIGWHDNIIIEWKNKDFEKLVDSDLLFARKFSSKHIGIVDRVIRHISNLK